MFLIVPHYFESATKCHGPCVYLSLSGNRDIGHDYVTKVTEKGNVCYFNNWINFAQLISKLISEEAHEEVHSRAKVKRKQSKQKRGRGRTSKNVKEKCIISSSIHQKIMSCHARQRQGKLIVSGWLQQKFDWIGSLGKRTGPSEVLAKREDFCTLNN